MANRKDESLRAVVDTITAKGPDVGSLWGHQKSGGIYEVITNAVREVDLTPVVVYQECQSGSEPPANPHPWVRPLSEFLDGRFTFIAPGRNAGEKS